MAFAACCCELRDAVDAKTHRFSSFEDGSKSHAARHAGASCLAPDVGPDVSDVIRSAAGEEWLVGEVELPS